MLARAALALSSGPQGTAAQTPPRPALPRRLHVAMVVAGGVIVAGGFGVALAEALHYPKGSIWLVVGISGSHPSAEPAPDHRAPMLYYVFRIFRVSSPSPGERFAPMHGFPEGS